MCVLTIFLKCNSMSNESNKNQDFISYILFYFYINLFLLYAADVLVYDGYEPQTNTNLNISTDSLRINSLGSLYISLVFLRLYCA